MSGSMWSDWTLMEPSTTVPSLSASPARRACSRQPLILVIARFAPSRTFRFLCAILSSSSSPRTGGSRTNLKSFRPARPVQSRVRLIDEAVRVGHEQHTRLASPVEHREDLLERRRILSECGFVPRAVGHEGVVRPELDPPLAEPLLRVLPLRFLDHFPHRTPIGTDLPLA